MTSNAEISWVEQAKVLRGDMVRTEIVFYQYLRAGEGDPKTGLNGACPWRGPRFTAFTQLLSHYDLADAARYDAFRTAWDAVEQSIRDKAAWMGVDGIIKSAPMTTTTRADFAARVEDGGKANGFPLSPRRIKDIAKQVHRSSRPSSRPVEDDDDDMHKTPAQLRAEIKALRRKNAQLMTEVTKLQAENKNRVFRLANGSRRSKGPVKASVRSAST
jgi:hypothetical protein